MNEPTDHAVDDADFPDDVERLFEAAGDGPAPAFERIDPATLPEAGPPMTCPRDAADWLLARGFRPVPTLGKDPGCVGGGWASRTYSPRTFGHAFTSSHADGAGILLGPGMGPDGAWLADLECDGPEGAESLRKLFGGDPPPTLGWDSARGPHRLYVVDQAFADALATLVGKPDGKGVYHFERLSGLEIRVGGSKPDGTPKALQSVCPPSRGTDGKPRRWFGPPTVATMPAAVAERLRKAAAKPKAERPPRAPEPAAGDSTTAYARKALEGECQAVATAPEGGRNNRLNLAALKLGSLVGAGALDAGEVAAALTEAARACGLADHEIEATIRSGLEAGKASPRDMTNVGTSRPSPNGKAPRPAPEPSSGPPPPPSDGAGTAASVVMRRASDVEPRAVEWLWRDRVPLGTLTLFGGDPKLGKSFLTIAMAAAVSRGWALPGGDATDGPGSVVLMSAEDDPERTVVPRLIAAGADLTRVNLLEAVRCGDGLERHPSLAADVTRIEDAVARLGDCRLIVIDPVTAYLAGIDDHKNAEIRGVLAPLKSAVERLNVACVLVTHLSKGGGTNAKHRFIGSVGYVGTCRANFLFARDPEDPSGRRVLMLESGCNLAGEIPALAFRVEAGPHGPTLQWDADGSNLTADDVLREPTRGGRECDRDARECEEWLREVLSAGPVKVKEVQDSGAKIGYTKDQLKRAKVRIGATSIRDGFGRDSHVEWMLPRAGPDAFAP